MFVRVKKTPNSPRRSVQIVHSRREDGKVRQIIMRHLGIARDDDEVESLKRLGRRMIVEWEIDGNSGLFQPAEQERQLREVLEGERPPAPQDGQSDDGQREEPPSRTTGRLSSLPVDLLDLEEEDRVVRGVHDVYGRLYDALGFGDLLPESRYRASGRILREIAMARLAQPASKRGSVRYLTEHMGTRLRLEQVYRMMDHLDERRIERLNRIAAERAMDLLEPPVDVYFFDCTTLYFESFMTDELKAPGYSKDAKFKESQVLLALMVTAEGLPVRHKVLPGHTFEGHSLRQVVDDFRRHVPLRRAVVVADRGMLSRANLKTLREADIDYIVGARLRRRSRPLTEAILDPSRYAPTPFGGVAEFEDESDRLVVDFSSKRARKDSSERQRRVDKLRLKCARQKNPRDHMSNRGYAKYLRVEGAAKVVLDEDKIREDARWDGLHGVCTSLRDMKAEDVLTAYRGLWQVEKAFRVTKHDLRVRPVFHWTPQRIRAHIAIAFITLVCVRHLEYRCALRYQPLSPEAMKNSLLLMQQSIYRDTRTGRRYAIPSRTSVHAEGLYRLVGVSPSQVPFELPADN